jgi:UDP-4-amino-4,6-dideoxy-N-acetyl-beta-L-altrosamine transaminase
MSPSTPPFLPYGRQLVDDDDVAAVANVLRGDYLTTGPTAEAFEAALKERTGAAHAVSCSSGTAALHMAMLALGLGPGDAAIVPTITFLATANAARFVGADVVFADVDPDSGLMRPADLRDAADRANGRAKVVLPVHLAGQVPAMAEIQEIARKHGLAVVEDACHALGSTYGNGVAVGACAHADMAAFSFHPVKAIAMGEGGAVTTNDGKLAAALRLLRNHGMTREAATFVNGDMAFDDADDANPWYYEMQAVGFNYRASDIHCALGLSQIKKLDDFVARRRALARSYDTLLAPLAPLVRPLKRTAGDVPAWHLYVALIDFAKAGLSRARLMRTLRDRNIGTQVHYIPVHAQPYYRRLYGERTLPGAEAYYKRCLTLPLHAGMTDDDAARVAAELTAALA